MEHERIEVIRELADRLAVLNSINSQTVRWLREATSPERVREVLMRVSFETTAAGGKVIISFDQGVQLFTHGDTMLVRDLLLVALGEKLRSLGKGEIFDASHLNDNEMLTPAEAAKRFGRSESSFRNRAAAGDFPGARKRGKQWLIPLADIEDSGLVRY